MKSAHRIDKKRLNQFSWNESEVIQMTRILTNSPQKKETVDNNTGEARISSQQAFWPELS